MFLPKIIKCLVYCLSLGISCVSVPVFCLLMLFISIPRESKFFQSCLSIFVKSALFVFHVLSFQPLSQGRVLFIEIWHTKQSPCSSLYCSSHSNFSFHCLSNQLFTPRWWSQVKPSKVTPYHVAEHYSAHTSCERQQDLHKIFPSSCSAGHSHVEEHSVPLSKMCCRRRRGQEFLGMDFEGSGQMDRRSWSLKSTEKKENKKKPTARANQQKQDCKMRKILSIPMAWSVVFPQASTSRWYTCCFANTDDPLPAWWLWRRDPGYCFGLWQGSQSFTYPLGFGLADEPFFHSFVYSISRHGGWPHALTHAHITKLLLSPLLLFLRSFHSNELGMHWLL